ncbi:unnamed protein product [Moneuplotes crassus]|uniref:Uncharacterized protein n=1 Tax=Euplotes crassus TaxID=5936 RepID=A0AAD1XBY1_EUPCR|nr:unnamed protein product [Moneuplotes crassus]
MNTHQFLKILPCREQIFVKCFESSMYSKTLIFLVQIFHLKIGETCFHYLFKFINLILSTLEALMKRTDKSRNHTFSLLTKTLEFKLKTQSYYEIRPGLASRKNLKKKELYSNKFRQLLRVQEQDLRCTNFPEVSMKQSLIDSL